MADVDEILKERQTTHGSFKAHAGLCQSLKLSVVTTPGWEKLSQVQREAIDMILHKIARAVVGNANHVDHWDDIQGYAKLVSAELLKAEPEYGKVSDGFTNAQDSALAISMYANDNSIPLATAVHMWKTVLSPSEKRTYIEKISARNVYEGKPI